MKIAYLYQVNGRVFEKVRGAQVHVSNIVRGLQRRGHDVRLMTLYDKGVICTSDLDSLLRAEIDEDDFAALKVTDSPFFRVPERAIRRLQSATGFPYLAVFDSARFFDAAKMSLANVDVIHERPNWFPVAGHLAAKRLRKPIIYEVNGDLIAESDFSGRSLSSIQRRYAVWTTRAAYANVSRFICVSTTLKEWMIRAWGLSENSIDVLPNAADIDSFGINHQADRVRQTYGLSDQLVILFVGGFYPWHDLELLLRAFKIVQAQITHSRLMLVGQGQTDERMRDLIVQLELADAVIMTGYIPHQEIPEFLAAADVAVSPLVTQPAGYGGSALKMFEYMAAGKAIIATRTGQQAEILVDRETALLVNPGDIGSMAAALLELMTDNGLRIELGRNARDKAQREHSWDSYAQALERTYERALSTYS